MVAAVWPVVAEAAAVVAAVVQQPAAVAQVFVGMEKIGNMQIASPQLTDVREMNSDGQPFIMATGPRLNAGDTLVLNLTGLPAHSNTPIRCRASSPTTATACLSDPAASRWSTRRSPTKPSATCC